jgi:hypothetical protein
MVSRRKSVRRKKSQKLYKMTGCNKKGCKKTKRRYLGGSIYTPASYPNAYPNPGPKLPENNIFLNSQLKKGGCGCGLTGGSSQNTKALVGAPWTSNPGTWPGVDGVNGNSNHYELNSYKVDPQTAIISTGAQPPFLGGGNRKNKRSKKQKGGNLSNFLTQDLINLGRQFQYGVGTAYNGITGYAAPTNPLPWKGQFQSVPSLATMKAAMI